MTDLSLASCSLVMPSTSLWMAALMSSCPRPSPSSVLSAYAHLVGGTAQGTHLNASTMRWKSRGLLSSGVRW